MTINAKKIIFDGLQMDVRKLSLCLPCQNASIGMQHDTAMASFDLGGPVTWGQILKLVFRDRHAWFTYKKHSGALGFAVISIIKKLFSKRFHLKRSFIFTFSLPSVTNDTQETEITTNKTETTTESTPLALVSSSGASDVKPRPAAACVCVCVPDRATLNLR